MTDAVERDLGVFVYGLVAGLTADGSRIVLWDNLDKGPQRAFGFLPGWVYERPLDGGPPVRLAQGWPIGLSDDGEWVLLSPRVSSRSTPPA